ncbi:MAG: MBL fold metallo-hydrolase [Oscillospiraceae bacterium]|nr:MBL fold metallo-hydrolase [Oscillospiraceae bacterium]
MRVMCLAENTQGKFGCLYEHGLCIHIETEKHRLLSDTGASDAFLKNAELLGVDIEKTDTVVLSHGHYDHSGGIIPFSKLNNKAEIYMQRSAGDGYYHIYPDSKKYIGIDREILSLGQVRLLDGDHKIDDELEIFTGITERRLQPEGNSVLQKKTDSGFTADDFCHEQYLVIKSEGKTLLVSGCAHNGIVSILDKFRQLYGSDPDIVISGFHTMKKTDYTENDIKLVKDICSELMKTDIKFFTGHCTGELPCRIMKEIMGDQLTIIRSGDILI